MAKESKQFWKDMKWGREHHSQLLKKHRDKWIAIFRGRVVSSGGALQKVQEQAQKITGQSVVAVKFIECGAHIYGL